MTFQNSILAGTTLVRDAITSEGFQSGVTGWSIKRDGDAEFNDVTVRGSVHIQGTDDPDSAIDLNIDVTGQPFFDITDAEGRIYRQQTVTGSGLDYLRVGPTNSPNSKLYFVNGEGIAFRSDATGAPTVFFDDDDGFLKTGVLSSTWTEEVWHEVGTVGQPAFANSFGNLGGGWNTLAYKIIPDGRVLFKGAILRSGSTADGTTIFTLPAGWRPPAHTGMACCNLSNNNSTEARVRILSTGVVQCYGQAAVGTNTAMALDGISFSLI